MKIEKIPVGMMEANCYLIEDEETKQAAVIDPGADGPILLKRLYERGLTLIYILLTHTHYDHIGAAAQLKRETGAKIAVSVEDAAGLSDRRWNLTAFTGGTVEPAQADILLHEGQVLQLGGQRIEVLLTPGHTRGGVCFLVGKDLFSGDTLFDCNIGRCDLPGGDMQTLVQSIQTKLMPLDDGVRVYPGHGPNTTIGRERAGNPYVRQDK